MGNLRGTKISASANMKSRINKKNKQFKIIKDQIEDKTRKEKQVLFIYCTLLFRGKYTFSDAIASQEIPYMLSHSQS